MNITINDIEMNTEMNQTTMHSVMGGFKIYGSWKYAGSYATGIRKGALHMSNYWVRKGRLFKRNGHQHGRKTITIRYVRRVREYIFA